MKLTLLWGKIKSSAGWRCLKKHIDFTHESHRHSHRAPVNAESDMKWDSTHNSCIRITGIRFPETQRSLFRLHSLHKTQKAQFHRLLAALLSLPPVDLVMVWHASSRSVSQCPAVGFFNSAGWGLAEPLEQNFKGLKITVYMRQSCTWLNSLC